METIKTTVGTLKLSHPSQAELPKLIELFSSEDLDLRRLQRTSHTSYLSQGKEVIGKKWNKLISGLRKPSDTFTGQIIDDLETQSQGLLQSKSFPSKDTLVTDPFNLNEVEK
jgi:hypothetical protein